MFTSSVKLTQVDARKFRKTKQNIPYVCAVYSYIIIILLMQNIIEIYR